ncbi:MAG: pyrroloquinoline quinone biosynthesis protein PqqE [Candidatus Thiodiazotropha sp. (ex Lucinoma kastoroae)]|nr:pyrroloquinoline quinone biosynthesis protein PqqE [Candidatus Thiodiazotropha sp. (ex Lucinoma kastoroae)]
MTDQVQEPIRPLWLLAEVTYSCPLQCPYCSNPLKLGDRKEELETDEWLRVLAEARKLGAAQLGLSGGEPLLRKDLEIIIKEARRLGYYTNLLTSGMGMSEARIASLKAAGLDHIQVSFQADDPDLNNKLAGSDSFTQKSQVAKLVKSYGYPMVLNIVMHRHNLDRISEILDMALDLGADYVELANAQYYGWALVNRDFLLPTREQLKKAEAITHQYQSRYNDRMKIYFVVPDYFEGRPKPCMNGWGRVFLSVSPNGTALPCHAAADLPGLQLPNVREHSIDWIWKESQGFNRFRGEMWMQEPCRSCDERSTCFGGCRCQAYLLTGDTEATDPACSLSPQHHVIQDAIQHSVNLKVIPQPVMRNKRNARNF